MTNIITEFGNEGLIEQLNEILKKAKDKNINVYTLLGMAIACIELCGNQKQVDTLKQVVDSYND